jgi:phenylpropionate dioxygenase-like ring-hydroxylating dioxygenase large terminal subunit
MLINNWYIAAEANDLKDQPLGVRLLGFDYALFRDGTGGIACLANVCCHRGGSISHGVVTDGCVACPYHGWQYDRAGKVIKIPALGEDATIPKRARIDSYPVLERWGYIWVFLGDMSEAERPVFPDFLPEFDDRDTWYVLRTHTDWNANWMRLGENFLDSSHLKFVHEFGKHLDPQQNVLPIEETEWGGRLVQGLAARKKGEEITKALTDALPDEDRDKTQFDIRFSIIGMMHRNHQAFAPGVTQLLWNAWMPIDDSHTRLYSLQLRTFKQDAKFDEQMLKTIHFGLGEDLDIVEQLEPVIAPPTAQSELFLETDGMEAMFRRKVREISAHLGAIDVRKLEQERKYQVLVIPSPARREDPKNWMHKAVPLIERDAAARLSAVVEPASG